MKAELYFVNRVSGHFAIDVADWRSDRPVIVVDNFSREKTKQAVAVINAHDALVDAVRMALESLDASRPPQEWDCRSILRDALKKATS